MAKRPPARELPRNFVTSKEASDLARLQARIEEAKRILWKKKNGDPWGALRHLGIATTKKPQDDAVGRRGRSGQAIERLAQLYMQFVTPFEPGRFGYARVERRDLWRAAEADMIDAQRERRPPAPMPAEFWFTPDRDVPMPKEDALRNCAVYIGLSRLTTWNLLNTERKRRQAAGLEGPDLPPRRGPRKRHQAP